MSIPHLSRRDVLLQGSVAIAGLALLRAPGLTQAFSAEPGEEVLTWLDQPAPNPVPDVVPAAVGSAGQLAHSQRPVLYRGAL